MSQEELKISLQTHEQMMDERNCDKAKAEIALQACFNGKDKKSKGKQPMKSKGNFQNFGERES